MKFFLLCCLLMCAFSPLVQGKCQNSDDCSNNGECNPQTSTCDCFPWYGGDNCSEVWRETYGEKLHNVVRAYKYTTIGTHSVVIAWGLVQLGLQILHNKNHKKKMVKWNISETMICIIIGASVVRIIGHGIDPLAYYGRISLGAEFLLFSIPILVLLHATALLVIYWMEILSFKGKRVITSVKRRRPQFYFFIAFSTVTILPCGVLYAFRIAGRVFGYLFVAISGLFVIALLLMSAVYGRRLILRVYKMSSKTQSHDLLEYAKKVTYFIVAMYILVALVFITTALFNFYANGPWLYLIFHGSMRLEEVGVELCILGLLQKKKPKREKKKMSDTAVGKIPLKREGSTTPPAVVPTTTKEGVIRIGSDLDEYDEDWDEVTPREHSAEDKATIMQTLFGGRISLFQSSSSFNLRSSTSQILQESPPDSPQDLP